MACDSLNKVFHEGLGSAKSDIETVAGIRRVTVDKLDCVEKLEDWVAEEVPVALTYNGISHAVMMCTPLMLEEFAVGFTLAERIVPTLSDI